MLTYLCNILKRMDQISYHLKELNQKHDEMLKKLDRIEKSLNISE